MMKKKRQIDQGVGSFDGLGPVAKLAAVPGESLSPTCVLDGGAREHRNLVAEIGPVFTTKLTTTTGAAGDHYMHRCPLKPKGPSQHCYELFKFSLA